MKLDMKSHRTNGLLITLCGLDGSGKTTQIRLLKDYLESQGKKVFVTKQPTDEVRNSDIFRAYMDNEDHSAYEYRALSLLCAGDRLQHSNKVILPLLAEGYTVISDRYYYSCLANLIARGYHDDRWIYEIAKDIPKPDAAIFLDIPARTAISRVRSRGEEKNRYIDNDLQYHLRELYLQIARSNGGIIVNTQENEASCFEEIRKYIDSVYESGSVEILNGFCVRRGAKGMAAETYLTDENPSIAQIIGMPRV